MVERMTQRFVLALDLVDAVATGSWLAMEGVLRLTDHA
jgi:hypothetical protein